MCPANERRRYKVTPSLTHWLGANLESALFYNETKKEHIFYHWSTLKCRRYIVEILPHAKQAPICQHGYISGLGVCCAKILYQDNMIISVEDKYFHWMIFGICYKGAITRNKILKTTNLNPGSSELFFKVMSVKCSQYGKILANKRSLQDQNQ